MDSQRAPSMSSKCLVGVLFLLFCFLYVPATPAPVGGVSNVGFSIYPAGSPSNHQTMHSRPFNNKVFVNYDVKHPPNPNPIVPGTSRGFRSQQNYYVPPTHQPQRQQVQHDWRRQHPEQQQPAVPPPQNWFVPDHVPQHQRPQFQDPPQLQSHTHQQKKRPRPIFLDEVQNWEDPNLSSHRRWNEERRAILGGAHQPKNVQTNIMPALDESAPLEYF